MSKAWQIGNFLEVKNDHLHIDGIDATELARAHGTPLFVFSEQRIRYNIERLKKVQSVIDCPLKICYAAKAMSTMGILHVIRDAGIDIEVNSGGELWKALKAGFSGEQIIFNGTSKEVWEIENAVNADVYAIQVDSLYELSLISACAKRLNKTATVSLRLVPEIESHTHAGLQTALLTSKFGMMPDEAFEAFQKYKSSLHVRMTGIHLHIGSQNPEPAVYAEALAKLFSSMLRIYKETGIKLRHVNLGGGFPVSYLSDDSVDLSQEQSHLLSANFEPTAAIREAWTILKEAATSSEARHLLDDLTILLEPGRSVIADAAICLTTVRNLKKRPVQQTETQNPKPEIAADFWLLVDSGFNILLSMETYKWYYHTISAERAADAHDFPYKIAGPLCDGGDVYFDIDGENRLPPYRLLPEDIQPNEVLALLNCGAYSLAQASQYNGRFLPAVLLIRENNNVKLIRKRDDFEDLVSNDVF